MKKMFAVALPFILSLMFVNITFVKASADSTSVVTQVEHAAVSVGKTVGNAIDSGKTAVKSGIAFTDTSSNFKNIYNDVKSGISGLASALKVGVEHVYLVLVKQQIVHAISSLLLFLIIFTLSIVLYNLSRKSYKEHLIQCGYEVGKPSTAYNIDIDDSAKGVASIIMGVLSGVALLISICVLASSYDKIIMGFVNPEYGAMQDIIEFVKNATGK